MACFQFSLNHRIGEAAKVDRDFKSSIMHVALTKITRNGHWSKQCKYCILHVVFSAIRYIFFSERVMAEP